MVVAVTAALSLAGLSGVDLADAAVSKAKSFADLMKQRSPGKRTAAQLIKTKGKQFRMLAASNAPAEEIPPAFFAPLVTVSAPPVGMLPAGFFPVAAPLFAESSGPFLPFLLAPGGGGIFVPGGGGTPGGGGGGPPGGGGGTTPPETPPVIPPVTPGVPEPGTWMTLILGFAVTGWTMRRRRATAFARS